MAGTASLAALPFSSLGDESPKRDRSTDDLAAKKTGLGLVIYCASFRRDSLLKKSESDAPGRADFDLYKPEHFLEHCRSLGAGGMQCGLGGLDDQARGRLRSTAEKHGLYIEAIVKLPDDKADIDRFDTELRTAKAVGARAARTTIIPGRRYEFFDSLKVFREYEARGKKSLELAAPIAEKHRIPLAVENHKDQRDADRVALFEHISSEFVGACLDTGNSLALLEDPISTVEAFAPWAFSVHLKDQALQLYDEGFLLADIPLGQGGLDLKRMCETIKKKKPEVRFSLELITRDPLKVGCLTEKYWATFPDLPARDLAQTLRYVRQHSSDNLQYVSKMSPADQLALEDANVRASLDYARDELKI